MSVVLSIKRPSQNLEGILRASSQQMPFKSAVAKAKKWYLVKLHERASQPQTSLDKFLSNAGQTPVLGFDSFISTNQQVPDAMDLVLMEGLVNNSDTTHNDKLAKTITFYAHWKYKNTEEQALKE